MEWWRGYTDHLVHGLTASGGSLASIHSDRETTEELITALVGQIQGSAELNLLTGLQVIRTVKHKHFIDDYKYLCLYKLGGSGSHHAVPGPVCEETFR